MLRFADPDTSLPPPKNLFNTVTFYLSPLLPKAHYIIKMYDPFAWHSCLPKDQDRHHPLRQTRRRGYLSGWQPPSCLSQPRELQLDLRQHVKIRFSVKTNRTTRVLFNQTFLYLFKQKYQNIYSFCSTSCICDCISYYNANYSL